MPIRFLQCYRFACSKAAGNFLYRTGLKKKSYFLMPNAIDTKRYCFNRSVREKVRQELGLADAFIIGHIGRFVPQKNHLFLMQTFKKIAEKIPSARLLLIGDGPKRTEIMQLAEELHLEERILFLGQRNDIPDLIQAMDLFLLPSIYEGLPVSCLEVQAAGLPCIASDAVSSETAYEEDFSFLPLGDQKNGFKNHASI